MKKGAGRLKGFGFEITVSRILTKWCSGQERPELFWRSAGSGAKATMSKKRGHATKMHGDIMSIDDTTMWVTDMIFIECKSYKEFTLDTLICPDKKAEQDVKGWWSKCFRESGEANKLPWLIFKRNSSSPYIMITNLFLSELTKWAGPFNLMNIQITTAEERLTICHLSEFLDWCDPHTLKLMLEEKKC